MACDIAHAFNTLTSIHDVLMKITKVFVVNIIMGTTLSYLVDVMHAGHGEALEAAKAGLAKAGMDGVILGGNYVCGVALGKCVEYGYEYAELLAAKAKAAPARQAALV